MLGNLNDFEITGLNCAKDEVPRVLDALREKSEKIQAKQQEILLRQQQLEIRQKMMQNLKEQRRLKQEEQERKLQAEKERQKALQLEQEQQRLKLEQQRRLEEQAKRERERERRAEQKRLEMERLEKQRQLEEERLRKRKQMQEQLEEEQRAKERVRLAAIEAMKNNKPKPQPQIQVRIKQFQTKPQSQTKDITKEEEAPQGSIPITHPKRPPLKQQQPTEVQIVEHQISSVEALNSKYVDVLEYTQANNKNTENMKVTTLYDVLDHFSNINQIPENLIQLALKKVAPMARGQLEQFLQLSRNLQDGDTELVINMCKSILIYE